MTAIFLQNLKKDLERATGNTWHYADGAVFDIFDDDSYESFVKNIVSQLPVIVEVSILPNLSKSIKVGVKK